MGRFEHLVESGQELQLVQQLNGAELAEDEVLTLLVACLNQGMAVASHVLSERVDDAALRRVPRSAGRGHFATKELADMWRRPPIPRPPKGARALFSAIGRSDLATVVRLLQTVPASTCEDGFPAFHVAVATAARWPGDDALAIIKRWLTKVLM